MFGMSMAEIVIILSFGLVILGPERIPDVARTLGKALREIRKASNLLRDAMLIDDPAPARKRTPAVAQTSSSETPSFDQADGFDDFDAPPKDPSAERNLQVVRMRDRKSPGESAITELTMAAPGLELAHREVYLHIPYEETI